MTFFSSRLTYWVHSIDESEPESNYYYSTMYIERKLLFGQGVLGKVEIEALTHQYTGRAMTEVEQVLVILFVVRNLWISWLLFLHVGIIHQFLQNRQKPLHYISANDNVTLIISKMKLSRCFSIRILHLLNFIIKTCIHVFFCISLSILWVPLCKI